MLVKSIKTLLVEDSAVLAERLRELVQLIPEIDLVAVVESEATAVSLLHIGRIDVVILDLQLREGTGIGVLKAIGTLARKPQIVVLTNQDPLIYQEIIQQSGADFFLDKAHDFGRLPSILGQIIGNLRNSNGVGLAPP